MSQELAVPGKLFGNQAAITAMYTPKGAGIHKSYPVEIAELGISELRYRSKFAVPVGTTLCISAVRGNRLIRFLVEVVGNQKNITAEYSVGCKILYGNCQKEIELSRLSARLETAAFFLLQ